jgi:hypothetical protein
MYRTDLRVACLHNCMCARDNMVLGSDDLFPWRPNHQFTRHFFYFPEMSSGKSGYCTNKLASGNNMTKALVLISVG